MLILQSPILFVDQLTFGHDGSRLYAAGARRLTNQKPESRGLGVWSIPGAADPLAHLLPDQFVTGSASIRPGDGFTWPRRRSATTSGSTIARSSFPQERRTRSGLRRMTISNWPFCRTAV